MRKAKWLVLAMAVLMVGTMSSCDFIMNLFAKTGIVTGVVYDAATDDPLAGVNVSVVGSNATDVTDAFGAFSIEAPEGVATLRFTKAGFMFADLTITVIADETVAIDEDVVAYEQLATGQYRIVLTWGENPHDLDSHLYVPIGAGYDEVYFSHKNASDGSANLDWDDTTSYGPETVTITTMNTGTYYYSIFNWSGASAGTIKASGATVKVYNSTGLVRTYLASSLAGTDDASNRYWRVFSMNNNVISAINSWSATGK